MRSISVLAVIAFRQILGVAEGEKKDLEGWRSFLRYLKDHSLSGMRLVISDVCRGLVEAATELLPDAKWQRCIVHFYRNVLSHLPNNKMTELARMLKAIHAQEDHKAAESKTLEVLARPEEMRLHKAQYTIEQKIWETFTNYSYLCVHWGQIRSTNLIEWIMREIRQHSRVVGALPDSNSALTLVAARLRHIVTAEWGRRRSGLWFILLLVSMPLNELCAQTIEPSGMLRLRIIDVSTGDITPARVEVLNGAGGSFIAEDALPISVVKDDARSADESLSTALGRFEKQTKSPYTGTNHFYTTGTASLRLPFGQYRVRAFKGPEYFIATRNVEVGAETDRVEEIKLRRFLDMPAKGWYSSDGHLHLPRTNRGVDPFIIKQMQAEDIHVGNILSFGNSSSPSAAFQYSYGPDSLYQEGNYLLRSGQENLRTHIFGHAITLGAKESLWGRDDYLIYRKFWQKAVQQGGINGYAHWGEHVNYNYVPSSGPQLIAPYGLMHFIEVLQFNRARYDIWYDMLNLGFRIAPTAGTDYTGGSGFPGDERFYDRVAGPLTFESWLEAVRKGRTFVTTGPVLEFSINGKDIGEEVILQKAGKVTIEGAVHFDPGKDVSDDENRRSSNCDQLFSNRENGYVIGLEIVQNGDVVRQFPRLDNSGIIQFKIEYDIASSSWLALRTIQLTSDETRSSPPKKAAIAHSAPIYVLLNHSPPITALPKAKVVARAWLARLDLLEERFGDEHVDELAKLGDTTDGVSVDLLSNSRQSVRSEIKAARTFYEKYLR